ncbi:MAG: hypothetical protein V7682_07195 [Cycloclasticus sp.]
MNLQELSNIGEVVSAVAVVVSLVYLAFQIRQNTRQIDENTKAAQAAAFDSSIAHTLMARQAIVENADVARIYLKGSNDPSTLSEEERVRYRLVLHNILWSIWNMQTQAQIGGLSSETWGAQLATLERVMTTPGFKWFWDNYAQEFGASFRQIVTDFEAKTTSGYPA